MEIFFVLSGFVIAYSAEGSSAKTFLQHRWIRLFPSALMCASITAMELLAFKNSLTPAVVFSKWCRSIIFFPVGPYVDDSYWTLSIEVAFYALIFLLLARHLFRHLSLVIGFIGCLSTTFWILSFILHSWLLVHIPWLADTTNSWVLNVLLVRYGCYFAVGVFLWLCLLKRATLIRVATILFCMVGGVLQIADHAHWVNSRTAYPATSYVPILVWLSSLLLIILSVYSNESFVRLIGDRGRAFTRRLGLMTYPLYLLHKTIGDRFLPAARRHLPDLFAFLTIALPIVLLSYLISRYAEPPIQRLFRSWLHDRE